VLVALGILKIIFILYTGLFTACSDCKIFCDCIGQAKFPFEDTIKEFLLGCLRCICICCKKGWIETKKATAEAGTAAAALTGDVQCHCICITVHLFFGHVD